MFGKYPGRNTLYFTSDGQAFFEENDANGQAANLKRKNKDASVTSITRNDVAIVDAALANNQGGGNNIPLDPSAPAAPATNQETKDPATSGNNIPLDPPAPVVTTSPLDLAKLALEGKQADLQRLVDEKGKAVEKMAKLKEEQATFTDATHTNKKKAQETKILAMQVFADSMDKKIETAQADVDAAQAAVAALEPKEGE